MQNDSNILISNTQELDEWIEREGIRYFKIGKVEQPF